VLMLLQWSSEWSLNGNRVMQDSECDELVQWRTATHGARHW